jgi:hypothetical protein
MYVFHLPPRTTSILLSAAPPETHVANNNDESLSLLFAAHRETSSSLALFFPLVEPIRIRTGLPGRTSEETSCRGQVFAPPMCNATAGRSPARPSAFPTDEAISPTMGCAGSAMPIFGIAPVFALNTSPVFSAVSKIVGNSRPRHALCFDFFDRGKAIKQEPAVAGPYDRALTVTTPLGASDMLSC